MDRHEVIKTGSRFEKSERDGGSAVTEHAERWARRWPAEVMSGNAGRGACRDMAGGVTWCPVHLQTQLQRQR